MVDAPQSVRFFVALVPPDEVSAYAVQVTRELHQRFNMGAAKAPPHITLQPPFLWPRATIDALIRCVAQFAEGRSPIPVTLSGFGAFPPRVLFINVLKTPELLTLQHDLMETMERSLGIVDPAAKRRAFAPHVTVASRNVTRTAFRAAWEELQTQPVSFEWTSDRLIVFVHNGSAWQTHTELLLKATGK